MNKLMNLCEALLAGFAELLLKIPFIRKHEFLIPVILLAYIVSLIVISIKLFMKRSYIWFTLVSAITIAQIVVLGILFFSLGHK